MKVGLVKKLVSIVASATCLIACMGILPSVFAENNTDWVAYGTNAADKVTITGEGSVANIQIAKPNASSDGYATAYLPAGQNNFPQVKENKLAFDIAYASSGATGSGTNMQVTYTWVTADNAGSIATTAGNKLILQFIDTDADSFKVRVKFGDSTVNSGALQTITPTGDVTGFVKGTTYRVVYETVADSTAANGYTTHVYFGGTEIASFATPAGSYQSWYTGTTANCGLVLAPYGGSNYDADFALTIDTSPKDTSVVLAELITDCKDDTNDKASEDQKATFDVAIAAAEAQVNGTEAELLDAVAALTEAKIVYANAVAPPPWTAYGTNAADKVSITGEGTVANIQITKPDTSSDGYATAYLPAAQNNFPQIKENKLAFDIAYTSAGATGSGTNMQVTYTWVTASNAGTVATTAGNKLILQFIDTDTNSYKVRVKFGDSTVNGGALQTITAADVTGFEKGTTYRAVYETVADSAAANGYTTYVYFGGQQIASFATPAGSYQSWYTGTTANCGLILAPYGGSNYDANFAVTIDVSPKDTSVILAELIADCKDDVNDQASAAQKAAFDAAITAAEAQMGGTEGQLLAAVTALTEAKEAYASIQAADVNWAPIGTNADTKVAITGDGSAATITLSQPTSTDASAYLPAQNANFRPVKANKFAFDITYHDKGTYASSTGANIHVTFTWVTESNAGGSVTATNNGNKLALQLIEDGTGGIKARFKHGTGGALSNITASDITGLQKDTAYRVVFETSADSTAANGYRTYVYFGGEEVASFETPSGQIGWFVSTSATCGLILGPYSAGNVADFSLTIDTDPKDTSEVLAELIADCKDDVNANASATQQAAFYGAILDAESQLDASEDTLISAVAALTAAKATYASASSVSVSNTNDWVAFGTNAATKTTITGEGSAATITLAQPTSTDASAYLPAQNANFQPVKANKFAFDITYHDSGTYASSTGANIHVTFTWVNASNAGSSVTATNNGNKLALQLIEDGAGGIKARFKHGTGGALSNITASDITGLQKDTAYRVVFETLADSTAANGYRTYVYFGGAQVANFETPSGQIGWFVSTTATGGLILGPYSAGNVANFSLTIDTAPEDTAIRLAEAIEDCYDMYRLYPGAGQVSSETKAALSAAIITAAETLDGNEAELLAALDALVSAREDFERSYEETFAFSGVDMDLKAGISMDFKVKKALFAVDSTYEAPYVTIAVNNTTVTLGEPTEEDDTYYVYTFDGLAPYMMGDTVTATLHAVLDGKAVESAPLSYSVKEHCDTILAQYAASTDSAEMAYRTMLVDLLNYGAAAQTSIGDTDPLVNAHLTAAQLAWGTPTDGDPALSNDQALTDTLTDETVTWGNVQLSHDSWMTLQYTFTTTESVEGWTVKVTLESDPSQTWTMEAETFTADGTGTYVVDFQGLDATQMREKVLATVYNSKGVPVSETLTYSIRSYAYANQDVTGNSLGAMVKAMMRYGDAAKAYVDARTVTYTAADTTALAAAFAAIETRAAADHADTRYVIEMSDTTYEFAQTITLTGVSDVIINGNGAAIIVTDLIPAITLTECANVVFRDLSADYDPLPYTQGVVTAINSDNSIVVDVDDGYTINTEYLNDSKYNYRDGSIYLAIHDRTTGAPAVNTMSYYSYRNAVDNGDGTISLTSNGWGTVSGGTALKVGDVVTAFPYTCSVFNMNECDTVNFTDVNVYSSGLSAFRITGGKGDNHLTNVRVVPGEKPSGATQERLKSINGDIVHAIDVEKGPTIENCTLTHSSDDIMNVHGYFLHVLAVNGNTVTVTPKWESIQDIGDTVEIYEATSYASKGTATIVDFKRYDTAAYKQAIADIYENCYHGYASDTLVYDITLDSAPNVAVGDHLVSLNAIGSGATVRNSHFGYNSARGLLIRGHNILIENCTFTNISGSAIKVQPELAWCEAGFGKNVVIRNNTFTNIGTGANDVHSTTSSQMGAITLSIEPMLNSGGGFFNCYELQNITIEGNTFTDIRTHAVSAINCNGITIKDNIINNPFCDGTGKVGALYGVTATSAIFVGMSKNITVTGNTVTAAQAGIINAVAIHNNCSGFITNSANTLTKN